MDDDALMHKAKTGDTAAFGQIVRRHQARLLRFAARFLNDRERAHDVVQDAFLKLWQRRATYVPQGALHCYLLRMVRNGCLDALRAERPAIPFAEAGEMPAALHSLPHALTQSRQWMQAVSQAVQSLPTAQREVFLLSHVEGLTYAEIAAIVGCPVGTVASRKAQAVATLRRRLSAWQEPETDAEDTQDRCKE